MTYNRNEYIKEWRRKNPEKYKAIRDKYRKSRKGTLTSRKYTAKWRKENKEKYNKIQRRTYAKNPIRRFKQSIRWKTWYKYGKTPKGMQRHHKTYNIDDFELVKPEKHLRKHGMRY